MDASDEFLLRAAIGRCSIEAGQRIVARAEDQIVSGFARSGANTASVSMIERRWGLGELIFLFEHRDEDALGLAETLSRNVHSVRRKLQEIIADEKRKQAEAG
jgi:hypothetical protein